ncbi:RNA recognition motif domain-containing protein [Hirsutella rhossiliensis]|uniref:RNA recognition motif domain-containing protein n=1 Tax=Hirsutella rhossiliensis TaxID=111463 RepID=A0A9P8N5W6_9HYPO|nr:RNA recognition motif domain-containing protein [Hirsutella rhossiliensis]KAH0967344.1 RNA recognition motif domain-containing protein [Hirsutella rhossiliensis]
MAYAPPPGTTASNSLPARPPASSHAATHTSSGFKPAFGAAAHSYSQYGAASSNHYPGAAPGVSSSAQGYPHQQQQQKQHGYAAPNSGYGNSSYAAPHIQNPFPAPGAGPSGYDPSEAAQIAEWQSAYNGVPQVGKEGKPVGAAPEAPRAETPADAANHDKKKTVTRQGGGKKWTDDTLLEWDPTHLRLFVGNLAGETTDESLLKAFARWKSVQKARVIRDKRTTKSKGYGFVSFSDADDFFQAAKEMNGKYIQSHPVVIRKANTEIKVTNAKERGKGGKHNAKNYKGKNNKSGGQQQAGAAYEPSLGPVAGGGVTKPGQKTKNGLRLLG